MKAVIYKPSKSAMQSGRAYSHKWHISISSVDDKFVDPIMGWTGSFNTDAQPKLRFNSCDEAVSYAKSRSIDYVIKQDTSHEKIKRKSYSSNFI